MSALIAILAAVGLVAVPFVAPRSETVRRATRVQLQNRALPISLRCSLALSPLFGGCLGILAVGLIVPPWAAAWVLLLNLICGGALFAVSYRPPTWLLPQWLRQEIERGQTALPRPRTSDWLLLVLVGLLWVGGILSWVYLVASGDIPPGG